MHFPISSSTVQNPSLNIKFIIIYLKYNKLLHRVSLVLHFSERSLHILIVSSCSSRQSGIPSHTLSHGTHSPSSQRFPLQRGAGVVFMLSSIEHKKCIYVTVITNIIYHTRYLICHVIKMVGIKLSSV